MKGFDSTPLPTGRGSRRPAMPTKIKIIIKDIILDAELFDTRCAKAIAAALPVEARPNEWGDEFYFEIPATMPLDETASTTVKSGDIGFWPPGNALAIFFGPTPMSSGSDPVPASAVNRVGRIAGDASVLKKAKGSLTIRIEKVSD
jgi:hypothetical protein